MLKVFGRLFLKLIGGSRNERIVRSRMKFVSDEVNPLEDELRALTDEQLLQRSLGLRQRVRDGENRERIKPEAFALVREAARRARNHRHFDVQLVAGMILDEGWIAEEATGEGKTIACYPAIYMAWLEGMHTHVVTTNDTLVQRDAEFARPVFELLGMTVGFITAQMPSYGRESQIRREAYARDVTYGTNSEFGFDYLRDNMKNSVAEQVQSSLDFAIVDEIDSILIDEARTPLIISGPAYGETDRYRKADAVAREVIARNRAWDRANARVEALKRDIRSLEGETDRKKDEKVSAKLQKAREELDQAEDELADCVKHYEVERDRKSVHLTHEGIAAAQEVAGIGSFYVGANMEWPHLMEQALRAHVVFERDKDYVVQDGEVVIVDEFTGRLMEGRQWSDGLHQAVEAKERVQIKEETQTLGTITLQNFFKLYRKLAGMTGTAMTEANEFLKIYKLDVASVPTHRPVNRPDHDDRIYADVKAKFEAVVEEVRHYSRDLGRPVLVGTTSIEASEALGNLLQRTYGIEHEVLNGRAENAARENDIVAGAGQQKPLKKDSKQMVGVVTIATNMAGRGTDIKLGPGVVNADCRVPDDDKLREMGLQPDPLYPAGVNKCCIHCQQHNASTNCAHCFKPKLDPDFPLRGRTECRVEVPCGLHIIGTERHEARRIDNQLRGRAGRQGDPGSSRFFLSLRDDLLAIFAGEWTVKVLKWLGLQGDQAIEDRRISKGIERAQKKVEERNFEARKNLLEYDEVMDHQRREFYSRRQKILEGRELEGLVRGMISESLALNLPQFLDGAYAKRCIAEWARQTLQIQIDASSIRAESIDDLDALEDKLRTRAKEEASAVISMTLGEYMDEDTDARDWDLRGLSSWAQSRFGVNLSQNQLRKMNPPEVEKDLYEAAAERIDELDLSPLAAFLDEGFAARAACEWLVSKYAVAAAPEELSGDLAEVTATAQRKVDEMYLRREIEYPVEHALEQTIGHAGTENVYAMQALCDWANRKYDLGWTPEQLQGEELGDVHRQLVEASEQWLADGKLEEAIRSAVGSEPDVQPAIQYARTRFDTELTEADFDGEGAFATLVWAGRRFLRREMTELERFVLLQIYDGAWKDHLLAMDHLRGGIGLRAHAEQDPRVAYKREGARQFEEMHEGVRDKVTDMIFKVRLAAGEEVSNVYQISSMVHEQLSGYDHLAQSMEAQRQQAGEMTKVETIRRDLPKVGRNDPCPCGSGRKYKKCCGKGT